MKGSYLGTTISLRENSGAPREDTGAVGMVAHDTGLTYVVPARWRLLTVSFFYEGQAPNTLIMMRESFLKGSAEDAPIQLDVLSRLVLLRV